MTTRVDTLLQQHSTNPVTNPGYTSSTNKQWTSSFDPIGELHVHTVDNGGAIFATYNGPFLPEYDDDVVRRNAMGYPPNARQWRLETEEDGRIWFHTEVSNIVLAAWAGYPVVLQTSEASSLIEHRIAETVDISYSIHVHNTRRPLVIGEGKRNLINRRQWQEGNLTSTVQKSLSRELRGWVNFFVRCPEFAKLPLQVRVQV